jgi:hypothetical protein
MRTRLVQRRLAHGATVIIVTKGPSAPIMRTRGTRR